MNSKRYLVMAVFMTVAFYVTGYHIPAEASMALCGLGVLAWAAGILSLAAGMGMGGGQKAEGSGQKAHGHDVEQYAKHQAWLAANGVQEGAAQGVGCSWTDKKGVVHEGVEYTSTRGGSVVREVVVDPATGEWRWV